MSLANVVILLLLIFEHECQNLHEADLTRNASSWLHQNDASTVTDSVDDDRFCGDCQSLMNEENDTDTINVDHRRNNNESHNNRSHTTANTTVEDNTEQIQLAGLTFKLCETQNLCRFLCNRTVQVNIGKFMGPSTGLGDGDLGPIPMQLNDGEFDGPPLLRRRRDKAIFSAAEGRYVLDEPPNESLMDASGVKARLRRAAQEDNVEIPESPNGQQHPEDTCTSQGNDCSCDKYCVIFGDCCVDVFEYWSGQNELTDLFGLISDVRLRTSIEGNFTNLAQMLESNSGNETNVINNFLLHFASCVGVNKTASIFIVSRCPRELFDESLRDKCEQLSSPLIPRILATLPGGSVVFKNVFCAQCHDVASSYLKVWSPKIACGQDSEEPRSKTLAAADLLTLIESDQCRVKYDVNLQTYPLRYCKPGTNRTNIINDGHQCSEMDSILCKAYYFQYDNYTNPHCEKCQNSRNLSGEVTFVETCNSTHNYSLDNPGILVILDISGRFSQGSNGRMAYFCRDEEVFDPLTSDCKQLICSLGQTPYRGICVDSADVYVPSLSQLFRDGWGALQILSNVTFPANNLICSAIHHSFKTFFYNMEKLLNSQRTESLLPDYLIFPCGLCNEYVNQTNMATHIFIDETLNLIQEFNKYALGNLTDVVTSLLLGDLRNYTNYMFLTNMVNQTRHGVQCQDGYNLTQLKDFAIDESNGEIYALISFMKQKFYYPLNAIGFEMTVTAGSSTAEPVEVAVILSVCKENKLFSNIQCKVVSYWLNQTSQDSTTLKILTSNQIYEEENFVIRGNEVFVCSNFASDFQIFKTPLVNSIFSLVVTLISIIFLGVMLVLYCMFPELLTLPGKLTACLATTLMMTFIFSIIPLTRLKHEVICAVLAAVNHLVTLAYFWWMSSIAFNMAWTFGPHSSSLIKVVSDTEAFRRFSIFVWGVSAAIVVPAVILDIIHRRDAASSAETAQSFSASSKSPEFPIYGQANCVWFQAPLWARLTFVLVPYFVSFVITVIGFAVTLIGLQRSRKVSEKVGKGSSERTHCLIYIKLSTAMGFSWILSIAIGFYPDSLELQYIYTGLTLLQGALLFLAFMANKRVYTLIRQRMQNKIIRGSQKTSSSTASTAYTN